MMTIEQARSRTQKPRKVYHLVVREGKSFSSGTPVRLRDDFDLAEHNAATERVNARFPEAVPGRKWTAAIRVDTEHSQALTLLDADKARSLAMLDRICEQVLAGHYNTQIRDMLAKFLDIEYSVIDEAKHRITKAVRALPDRTATGPIECWAQTAIWSYMAEREYQCTERARVISSIIAAHSPGSPPPLVFDPEAHRSAPSSRPRGTRGASSPHS